MASKQAIGIMRESAINKLNSAMHDLFGEGFILPTQGRDPALLHAQQLDAIANYLECQAQGVVIPVEIDLDNTPTLTVSMPSTVSTEATATITRKPARRKRTK